MAQRRELVAGESPRSMAQDIANYALTDTLWIRALD